jgi:hypothetical protein
MSQQNLGLILVAVVACANVARAFATNGGKLAMVLDKVLALVPDFHKLLGTSQQPSAKP